MGFLDFLGAIGDVFSEIASIVTQLFIILWNYLIILFTFLWNVIVALANGVLAVFQTIGKWMVNVWQNYIRPGIVGAINIIEKIRGLISHWANKIIGWVQKAQAWYNRHILPGLQRQIALIQKIRQFLTVLRIFHVKFAVKLDNYLAQLQGEIQQSIQAVLGTLNLVIDWIAIITDQTNLIRRNVLGAWLLTNLGALKRVIGYGNNRPLTANEQALQNQNAGRYATARANDHINALTSTGLTANDLADRAAARKGISDATGTPLPF